MTTITARDASERITLAEDAAALNLIEFWAERDDIELTTPRNRTQPHKWSWSDVEPRLRAAARIVPIEEAERRVLICANPGLDGKPYTSQTILAAYALYNPGETAPVHRHTPSAARFVLEGAGGYTMVAGEKITMSRGDLVLTPSGLWHDHGAEGDSPVVWVDILNFPLVEALDATIFDFDYVEQNGPDPTGTAERRDRQTMREPSGHSGALYATGGVTPLFADHRRGPTEHSPQFFYRYDAVREALERMRGYEGSPFDGLIVEYTDPARGGSVMPSLSFRAQLLRRGETVRRQRRMASTVYCVIEGCGSTEIGGRRFDWRPNDIFVVPNWTWFRHLPGTEDAVLLSATDEPAMQKLGLYRHEGDSPRGD